MVNDTALMAINTGSNALISGELASVAEDTPNSEAIGLAHTPIQAPLLQQDNKTGAAEVRPPVIDAQNDFFAFIIFLIFFLF
jgi:hypothetical protein